VSIVVRGFGKNHRIITRGYGYPLSLAKRILRFTTNICRVVQLSSKIIGNRV